MITILLVCLILLFPHIVFAAKPEDASVLIGATIFMVVLVAVLGLGWRTVRFLLSKKKAESIHAPQESDKTEENSIGLGVRPESLEEKIKKMGTLVKFSFLAFVSLVLLAGFYIHSENTRFCLTAMGDKPGAFKMDRHTGRVWLVLMGEETLIEPRKVLSPEDAAIRLTKDSHALGGSISSDSVISSKLEKLKGYLYIFGWKAKKIGEGKYLVSYTYDRGFGAEGFFFEVMGLIPSEWVTF